VPRPNRVSPFGDLVAVAERGLVYGNRGGLHDDSGRIRRRFAGRRWIACRLRFRDGHRSPLLQPGRFTELFFLDEATAFAAGHRPCALCRSADFRRFLELWTADHPGETKVDAVDRRLHTERLDEGRRGRRTHRAAYTELPDGAMVVIDREPWLVLGPELRRWTFGGYGETVARPDGMAEVLTPPSLLNVLAAGWSGDVPLLHPSALAP
jgi:hypothetical protein